jgi:hypothetical protein
MQLLLVATLDSALQQAKAHPHHHRQLLLLLVPTLSLMIAVVLHAASF